jgi:hypothetical protein
MGRSRFESLESSCLGANFNVNNGNSYAFKLNQNNT